MNLYKAFKDLLPDAPLQIGTVTAISGGTATITMIDGGIAQARGSAGVGQRVCFRDGVIESVVPSLTVEVIDV